MGGKICKCCKAPLNSEWFHCPKCGEKVESQLHHPEYRRLYTLFLRDKAMFSSVLEGMSNTEVAHVARTTHGEIYKRLFTK